MPHDSGPTTLYRLFSAEEDLIYVGIAGNPGRRFEQHAEDKPWWSAVATIRLEHFDTRDAARAAERHAIATELPYRNKADVPAHPRPVKLWPGTLAQFADCCEVCVARNGDYDVHIADATWAKGEGLTARYRCGTCGHVWTCWWAWRIAA